MEAIETPTNHTTPEPKMLLAQFQIDEPTWTLAKASAMLRRQSASEWAADAVRQRLEREPIQG